MTRADSPTVARARGILLRLAWMFPFFAIPIARCRLREDADTETASVTADGLIRLSPTYVGTLSDAHLLGVLAHEICHPLLGHHRRFRDCDPHRANVATDMAINHGLRASGIELPEGALYPRPEWEQYSAEEIYRALDDDDPDGGDAPPPPGPGQPAPGQGCGPLPPEGDDDQDGDGNGAGPGPLNEAEIAAEWCEVAVQAAALQASAGRGEGKGAALVALTHVPPPRVHWAAVLRQGTAWAQAAHGRDETTWARRGRRSAPTGPQFAGWTSRAARVAVAIDTSGSMSDAMVAQAVAETVAAVRQSGVSAYLVTHDHGVQWSGWIHPRSDATAIAARCTGRGGTCAREAYAAIAGQRARFDVFIHLTDCGLSWPAWPANTRKRIVAHVGRGSGHAPTDATLISIDL